MSSAQNLIFRGTSGGFDITWTLQDIIARSVITPSQIVFSARAMAEQSFESDIMGGQDLAVPCEEARRFTILSIVGPLISYLDQTTRTCEGAARSQHDVRFTTLDLSEPDSDNASGLRQIRLDNFFSEADLLRAFLADPLVRRTLQDEGIPNPQTLRNLEEQVLSGTGLNIESAGDSFVAFDPRANFAFHHLEDNNVAVRICITPRSQVLAGTFSQLGILLPIPSGLSQSLRQADSLESGFLMRDHANLSRGESTNIFLTSA